MSPSTAVGLCGTNTLISRTVAAVPFPHTVCAAMGLATVLPAFGVLCICILAIPIDAYWYLTVDLPVISQWLAVMNAIEHVCLSFVYVPQSSASLRFLPVF